MYVPRKLGEFWNLADFSFELRVSIRPPAATYCVFRGIIPRVFCEPRVATEGPKHDKLMGMLAFSAGGGGATEE